MIRLSRLARLAALPLVVLLFALAGCGSSATKASSDSASTPSATPTTSASSEPTSCPTENTRAFAKTRFVADIGLIAGTFHRYIYKPYQAGTFQKGADGRTKALIKATLAAALDAKLMSNAYKNVQASPVLCNALAGPLLQLEDLFAGLKGKIATGDLASIASIAGLIETVKGIAGQNGATIVDNDDLNAAKNAA